MQELQAHAERLQHENDQLRAQVEESRDLGKDVRDDDRVEYPIARNKGKEPIISGNSDTSIDDELSTSPPP